MKPLRRFMLLGLLLLSTGLLATNETWGPSPRGMASASETPQHSSLPLRLIADIPLPGTTGRFDYQSLDPDRHRLFIAHLGDSAVVVFDTELRRVIGTIPRIEQVHGVLAVPALGRVFATATGQNQVAVIDEQSLRVVARMPGGTYPDGLAYAPSRHKLYISDETGKTETVVDVQTNKVASTISLGGEVGNTQYDPMSKHVFVDVQTRNELAEIDPATDTIVQRYSLSPCDNDHGLYIDAAAHLAYVACTGDRHLLVFDLVTKRVLNTYSIARDADVLAFDPDLRLLYVASESGVVSVFRRDGRELQKLGEAMVASHAHSIAVDPRTHLVYLPLQDIDGKPMLRIMSPSVF